ncbi:TIGR03084 family protein [Modestobacter sp. DSM 44400]|uniref:TIGR03084 family metal-binding protein n=1 Tax=Modestobacter sp. DSM 44400 TaxID=1550230 RepID=UPI00089C4B31|nr:TIGR03084 family metal-binding protein [Modestobacter sp. DSM 44400]SDY01383.1 TIGR03084 family protein [Modestobacter sp. DSM 44400]
MPVDMAALIDDLAAESTELDAVLATLQPADWKRPTPAVGWSVQDQVTHLAFFDEAAVTAATEPDRFREEIARPGAGGGDVADCVAARYRSMPPGEAMAWFSAARRRYLEIFVGLDPTTPLPWYGPPMSAASSVTARLMETWAHGQDVFDALARARRPTARLRHIAHLGVRTLGWSFQVNGRPRPDVPVRVELTAPEGGTWTWGPADAPDRVSGPAEDFCLLVTQRRNRDRTALRARGPVANAWLDLAQAFAGPAGGR